jgi:succinate-semialdehyde dehydrogenase/glutarate-semialdehyde dehydrogenase
MEQCARQVKKVSLELGGNAPFIIFEDADLDEAAAGAVLCKYRNSGQTCISANRILVQDSVHDEFLRRLAEAVTALKVGAGTEPDVNVGPLIDDQALAKVERHVADALDGGAELVTGGDRHERGHTFFQPTVLSGVTASMAMTSEETFGPVAAVGRFATEQEAIEVANSTLYGLAAYFYSRDVGRIWRVSEALEYGVVGINTGFISTEVAPFGGMKESGIGREGSKYGIEEWLELKYLAMGGV